MIAEREAIVVSPAPETQQQTPGTAEEPFVEQFFPRQMSWYAAEGPQGSLEEVARWVRENPWKAVGLAAAAGIVTGWLAAPAIRLTATSLMALCPFGKDDADSSVEQ